MYRKESIVLVMRRGETRDVMAEQLRERGYQVACCDEHSKLERCGEGTRVAMIITDLVLPESTGLFQLGALAAKHPRALRLLLVPDGAHEIGEAAMAEQLTHLYLCKPVSTASLLSAIHVANRFALRYHRRLRRGDVLQMVA